MGYGKTTAVRSILADEAGTVLWMHLPDASPVAFWHDFCRLLASIDETSAALLEQLPPPVDATTLRAAVRLFRGMPKGRGCTVVVDDYHLADVPETSDWLGRLAESDIAGLRVLIVTRSIRLPRLEELRLKGLLHFVGKHAFEFSADDIVRYFRMNGVALKKTESSALRDRTEGWISALYLLLVAHRASGRWDTTSSVDQLLKEAVFDPLPERERRWLLRMSLFDRFTLRQAAHMCEDEAAVEGFEALVRRNAFIRFDPSGSELQVHRLFNGFLRDQLERTPAIDRVSLHRLAGRWHAEEGDLFSAMRHFREAGDFDLLLDALERDLGASIRVEQKAFLLDVLDVCPGETLFRHPVAVLIACMCLTTFNEMTRCLQLCSMLQERLEQGAYGADSPALTAELLLFSSFGHYNDAAAMVECCRTARACSDQTVRFMDTSGSWMFGSPSVLYMFHREAGRLDETLEVLKIGLCDYQRLTAGHGTGAEHLFEAEALYGRGSLQDAEISVNRALFAAERADQPDIQIGCLFLLARMAMMSGRLDAMDALLARMNRIIERYRAWALSHTVDLCRGYLQGCLQRLEGVPEWLSADDGHPEQRLFFQALGFASMVHARALLLRREPLRLIGIADGLVDGLLTFPSQPALIHVHICRAAANLRAFRHSQALEAMRAALEAAAPDGLAMPFAESLDLAGDLLKELAALGEHSEFISQVFRLPALCAGGSSAATERTANAYRAAGTVRTAASERRSGSDRTTATDRRAAADRMSESGSETSPLTVRERQIADMAAAGCTNREIGERLYITENTVKTILKNVFEKLGIRSRALLPQALGLAADPE